MQQKVEQLFLAAQKIGERTPEFFKTKGPGPGDRAALEFMSKLREVAEGLFGRDHSEQRATNEAKYSIDFYFADEATAVEVAFSLDKSINEYERDIFKCLLARESGLQIQRLIFFAKPGGLAKQSAPGPKAIADYVKRHFDLEIEIWELVPPETQAEGALR